MRQQLGSVVHEGERTRWRLGAVAGMAIACVLLMAATAQAAVITIGSVLPDSYAPKKFERVQTLFNTALPEAGATLASPASGAIVRWYGTCTDIHDRRVMEAALRESEDRFRRAIAASPHPIMIHAEDGTVVGINQAWEELTGYPAAALRTTADWIERAYGPRPVGTEPRGD